jgi:hypothetical protein
MLSGAVDHDDEAARAIDVQHLAVNPPSVVARAGTGRDLRARVSVCRTPRRHRRSVRPRLAQRHCKIKITILLKAFRHLDL